MLEVGMYLTLEPMAITEKKEEYRCRITDLEDGKIYIDYPINTETNRTVYLVDGMQLSAGFIDPKSSSAIYIFQTEIVKRERRNIPMLVLRDPGVNEYIRIQRRKYVRVSTPVDVAVYMEGLKAFTAATEDISAGGLAVVPPFDDEIKKRTRVKLFLTLPMQSGDYYYLELNGSIVRVGEEKEGRKVASIEFLEMNGNEQQILMKFCFERQLMLKRKGLI
ncbi:c-di-GMP-binding flagellar brake protein YcgR [Bacillus ectoiniformans]|uniref:flagellar brake protein n=1 Tax=Bacillus ectoiniformans TaxID=1494429 RepID=UPI00195A32F8|nr:flagellar brake domain-containing protein [Bacillus ectoiniformans]MBM7648009.1 c-di-GMP-binding flagellar brake protein YcgR [Bacillus ectoiniformans]